MGAMVEVKGFGENSRLVIGGESGADRRGFGRQWARDCVSQ